MKSVFALAFIIFTLSMAAVGQYPGDEPVWATFQSPYLEFAVDFPGKNVKSSGIGEGQIPSSLYKMSYEKSYFFILTGIEEADSPYAMVRDYAAANSAASKEIEIDGRKGTRYDFRSDDGFEHSFIAIQGPAFFYLFYVTGETRNEGMFEKFLGSIKLTNPLSKPALKSDIHWTKRNRSLDDILKKDVPALPPTSALESLGVMSSTSPVAPPKYSKITAGVTITGKPRQSYTDLAHKFQISGIVRLRVSFQKDGKIGEITPTQKLPFGLTGSSIRAARQLTFVAAMREGEPYTVEKNVEYIFNLY